MLLWRGYPYPSLVVRLLASRGGELMIDLSSKVNFKFACNWVPNGRWVSGIPVLLSWDKMKRFKNENLAFHSSLTHAGVLRNHWSCHWRTGLQHQKDWSYSSCFNLPILPPSNAIHLFRSIDVDPSRSLVLFRALKPGMLSIQFCSSHPPLNSIFEKSFSTTLSMKKFYKNQWIIKFHIHVLCILSNRSSITS